MGMTRATASDGDSKKLYSSCTNPCTIGELLPKLNLCGVASILCCNADNFLQALEGPRNAINTLYNRLTEDNRHKDLTILDYEEISVRRYANWSMGWAGAKQANRELFLKYSCSDRLAPFSMSTEQINGLLLELSANVSTISAPIID